MLFKRTNNKQQQQTAANSNKRAARAPLLDIINPLPLSKSSKSST